MIMCTVFFYCHTQYNRIFLNWGYNPLSYTGFRSFLERIPYAKTWYATHAVYRKLMQILEVLQKIKKFKM